MVLRVGCIFGPFVGGQARHVRSEEHRSITGHFMNLRDCGVREQAVRQMVTAALVKSGAMKILCVPAFCKRAASTKSGSRQPAVELRTARVVGGGYRLPAGFLNPHCQVRKHIQVPSNKEPHVYADPRRTCR